MFTHNTLITMLEIQNNLNKAMGGNAWLHSDNTTRPYYRAAWVEGGEAVSHYGYKWWKAFDRSANIGQTKLEVVDMLHFVLSDELRYTAVLWATTEAERAKLETDENGMFTDGTVNLLIEATAERVIKNGVIDIPDDAVEDTFLLVAEQFVGQTLIRRRSQIRFWGALADALNLTMEEAGLLYIGKAALNFHRDSNGQKEGTYVKNWWGKEDNVWLEQMINAIREERVAIPADSNAFNVVSEYISEQYRRLMVGEPALII